MKNTKISMLLFFFVILYPSFGKALTYDFEAMGLDFSLAMIRNYNQNNNYESNEKDKWSGDIMNAGRTIGLNGCYITSLANILYSYQFRFIPDSYNRPQPFVENQVTPRTFNTWLQAKKGYAKDSASLTHFPIDSYFYYKNYPLPYHLRFMREWSCYPFKGTTCWNVPWKDARMKELLHNDLYNHYPVVGQIRYVDAKTKSTHDSHFLVITGYSLEDEAYRVADPTFRSNRNIYGPNYPINKITEFESYNFLNIRRYKAFYSRDYRAVSYLQLAVHSPIEVQIISPDGLTTGYDPVSQDVVTEIPQSAYYDDTISPPEESGEIVADHIQKLDISQPAAGNYILKVIGAGEGEYAIDMEAKNENDVIALAQTLTGTASLDMPVLTYRIKYSPTGESSMSTNNQFPIANAGMSQKVILSNDLVVNLTGEGSSDPDGDPLKYSWSFVSKPNGSTASLNNANTINPSFAPDIPGLYAVQLVVNDHFADSLPTTATITVMPQEGIISVTPTVSTTARVLVLTDSSDEYKDQADKDQAYAAETVIQQALNGLGVFYKIAKDIQTFKEELRSGLYNTFILSGNKPLTDHLDEELTERINAGDGVLFLNYGNLADSKIIELAGVKTTGTLPAQQRTIALYDSPVTQQGSITSAGKIQKLQNIPGQNQTAGTTEDKGAIYPAVILRQFGEGRATIFAFLPEPYLIQNAVSYIKPATTGIAPYTSAPVEITLRSIGASFELKIVEEIPGNTPLLLTYPNGVVEQNTITWTFSLLSNEQRRLIYLVRMPEDAGSYSTTTKVYYRKDGSYELYNTYLFSLDVSYGLVRLKADILNNLKNLGVPGKDVSTLSGIIGDYQDMLNRTFLSRQDLDSAIKKLLGMIGGLKSLTVNTMNIRLDMDRLLKAYERTWSER